MLQSPNYIHFRNQWQVLGLDAVGQWPDKKAFLKLMDQLNEAPIDADFDDFSYKPEHSVCEMGKLRGSYSEGGQAFTKIACATNQITLVEEWTESTAEHFKDKFVEILKIWFRQFPHTAVIAQKCCLRALVQPTVVSDSRDFLGHCIMKIREPMQQTFKTMPFKVGFTFTCLREMQGYYLYVDTTVNSWRDNRRVWLQVEGSYPMREPMNASNPDKARFPFEDCQSLLESEVIGFLNQFDRKEN
jgi:hypothetical protein